MIASRTVEARSLDYGALAGLIILGLTALVIASIAVYPDARDQPRHHGRHVRRHRHVDSARIGSASTPCSGPLLGNLQTIAWRLRPISTEPLFALFLVSWALHSTITHGVQLPKGRHWLPVATLLLVVIASSLVTTKLSLTLKEGIKWLEIVLLASYVSVNFREGRAIRGAPEHVVSGG